MQLLEKYKIHVSILELEDVQVIMLNLRIRLLKSMYGLSLYLCVHSYTIMVSVCVCKILTTLIIGDWDLI